MILNTKRFAESRINKCIWYTKTILKIISVRVIESERFMHNNISFLFRRRIKYSHTTVNPKLFFKLSRNHIRKCQQRFGAPGNEKQKKKNELRHSIRTSVVFDVAGLKALAEHGHEAWSGSVPPTFGEGTETYVIKTL